MVSFERKCLQALALNLEKMTGFVRSEVLFPEVDKQTPIDQRIDAVIRLGPEIYAIEHTLIEPYDDFQKISEVTRELEKLFREILVCHLDIGVDFCLPSDWLKNFPRTRGRIVFAQSLADALSANASKILKLNSEDKFFEIGDVKGVNVSVFRNGFEELEESDARPGIVLMAGDYNSGRILRLNRSMNAKLPKLSNYKDKCKTVLLLENRDFSLTGPHSVDDALHSMWTSTQMIPVDYLFLINTSHTTWQLYPLVEMGSWASRKPGGLRRYTMFKQDDLLPIDALG